MRRRRLSFKSRFHSLAGLPFASLSPRHPSGAIKPSEADLDITQRIASAAQILQVNFLDHIIVGQGFWCVRHRENLPNNILPYSGITDCAWLQQLELPVKRLASAYDRRLTNVSELA